MTNIFKIIFIFTLILNLSCSTNPVGPTTTTGQWETVSPESQNVNPAILNMLTNKLSSGELGLISSFLIARNGKLVYEKYFMDMGQDSLHSIYSVTKSFTATLIGRMIADKQLSSVDLNLLTLFDQYVDINNISPAKSAITLEHVLQMRSGFEWGELDIPYSDRANIFHDLYASSDPIKFVLDQLMENYPGTGFDYNTGCSMLLGDIIRKYTGEDIEDYARRILFDPMDIENYQWPKWPSNVTPTGSGLKLRLRDMAKLGQLYLNNGKWNNEQIISLQWIEQATYPHSLFQSGYGYGYQWWLMNLIVNGQNKLIPQAIGYGDQYVMYIKELNVIVAATSEHFDGQPTYIREIMQNYVIPAIN